MSTRIADDVSLSPTLTVGARRVVPWLLLAGLMLWMFSLYSQYQARSEVWEAQQAKSKVSLVATATTTPNKPKPPAAAKPSKYVHVLTGINFRTDPSGSSDTIRTLEKGERLAYISKVGAWYKVRDHNGKVGWVTAGKSYTKVVKAD